MSAVMMDNCCTCGNPGCTSGVWLFTLCANYYYSPMSGFLGSSHYNQWEETYTCSGYSSHTQYNWDPLAGLWFLTDNTVSGSSDNCIPEGCAPDYCTINTATNTTIDISFFCDCTGGTIVGCGHAIWRVSNEDIGSHYGFAPFPSDATLMFKLFTAPGAPGCGGSCDPSGYFPDGYDPTPLDCCVQSAAALDWVSTGYLTGYWQLSATSCVDGCYAFAGSNISCGGIAGGASCVGGTTFVAPNGASCDPSSGIGGGGSCCGTGSCFSNTPGGCGAGGTYVQQVAALYGVGARDCCVATYGSCSADPACETGVDCDGRFFNPADGAGIYAWMESCFAGRFKPACCS